ncbi:hypothetical protein [Ruminococcus sp.]|uniref:hypothetical protein n=1 Tax=Ruminococcus sp. TaxID=41978 RepID=UPI001B1642F9|nr:hypothetical protein [Ruminococcus sp.]MBO5558240.1 hypothetical protein [Ruminococcus sp.]
MILIKSHVPYQWTEDGVTEYGDLFNADVKELFDNKLDCFMLRCYHCDNIISAEKSVTVFKSNNGDRYAFCQCCSEKLFE